MRQRPLSQSDVSLGMPPRRSLTPWTLMLGPLCLLLLITGTSAADPDPNIFLIFSNESQGCLEVQESTVKISKACNSSLPAQQWLWVSRGRLFNVGAMQCLWVTFSDIGNTPNSAVTYECDHTAFNVMRRCTFLEAHVLQGLNPMAGNYSQAAAKDGQLWIYGTTSSVCSRAYSEIYTIQGNSHGRPCAIPFKYDNQWFYNCTSIGREDGHLWCATTVDYGKEDNWGFCPVKSDGCETFWEKDSQSINCYQFNYQSALSWNEAWKSCQQQGANLLSINAVHEQTFISEYNIGSGEMFAVETIHCNSALFSENTNTNTTASMDNPVPPNTLPTQSQKKVRRASLSSMNSENSGSTESLPSSNLNNITANWWGAKRIDYALYCPDVLTAFPTVALPHLFHASYWESTDVVAFILRQVMRYETAKIQVKEGTDSASQSPSNPREKWLRKRTHVKLRNVTANHRANDVIAAEDGPQVLIGRFMYGPLDMVALTGEKVDILVMTEPSTGRWLYFDTEISNSSGRISYNIPKEKRLGVGVFPIKMVVRGDQTTAVSYLTVLPRGMECVVFSIDGSFAASVSIMGSDPKVRAGAVDVVRHWQDLGYLIIYITGRPDMQKQRVVSWLSQHNFPQGMIFFSDGLVHDPLRQKTIFLRNLMQECHIKICAAYGSMKDISVYNVLGLSSMQIYIVGRPAKKYQNQCQFISDGYAAHLATLEFSHHSRPKKNNSRMILRKGSFGLHTQPEFLRKRNHLRRTMSVQQPDPPSSNPKPERAQSQPESDKDHDRHLSPMSWVRSGSHKFEPAP